MKLFVVDFQKKDNWPGAAIEHGTRRRGPQMKKTNSPPYDVFWMYNNHQGEGNLLQAVDCCSTHSATSGVSGFVNFVKYKNEKKKENHTMMHIMHTKTIEEPSDIRLETVSWEKRRASLSILREIMRHL